MECWRKGAISSRQKLWPGYRKTTVAANTAPDSAGRVITPNKYRGIGDSSTGEKKPLAGEGKREKNGLFLLRIVCPTVI